MVDSDGGFDNGVFMELVVMSKDGSWMMGERWTEKSVGAERCG